MAMWTFSTITLFWRLNSYFVFYESNTTDSEYFLIVQSAKAE